MKFESDTMDLNIKDAVGYLTFKKLEEYKFLKHAFSTRLGGVSKEEYRSMNFRFSCSDKYENVIENYKIFCKAVGLDYNSLVLTNQTHTCNIRKATNANVGVGIVKPQDQFDIDGLITNEIGVTLVTFHADCVPIFIVDTSKRVICLLHAGWKGTVNEIGKKAISMMKKEYGCDVNNIICAIGPSIGKCCYEVSSDVFEKFREINYININDVSIKSSEGKFFIDLNKTNKLILQSEGISENNIVLSDLCTKCSSDLLISHRATGGKRGVMAAMMCMDF